MTTPVDDYFRSHLPNQHEKGGRKWLYPRATSGRFTRWRTGVAIGLLAALFAGPFVWVNGHPLFLFNVLERRFIFFGVTFWPQDFYLVAIGLLAFIVFIALFTVVYGRVWCGWACPQTVFMEMVFRPVERWIEGDYKARQRLDAAPWTTEKLVKKGTKQGIFFLISFAISNTFLAYLIGRDEWLVLVIDPPSQHIGGLTAMLLFTAAFYVVFANLREIVCTTICPYGRLQSVLLDQNSLVVAYDPVRGEPRGKVRKIAPTPASIAPAGDCIDCKLCVQVCPTGIDIRNGLQMECVNCTACIDACDEVMDKVDRPRGLIRYDSLTGIQSRKPWRFTGRMAAYSAVLGLIVGVWAFLLTSRTELQTSVLRAPGQLFQREAGGLVSNLYQIELINKTYHPLPITLRVQSAGATIRMVQPIDQAPAGELTRGMFFILLPEKNIRETSTHVEVEVLSNGTVLNRVKTTFMGPLH